MAIGARVAMRRLEDVETGITLLQSRCRTCQPRVQDNKTGQSKSVSYQEPFLDPHTLKEDDDSPTFYDQPKPRLMAQKALRMITESMHVTLSDHKEQNNSAERGKESYSSYVYLPFSERRAAMSCKRSPKSTFSRSSSIDSCSSHGEKLTLYCYGCEKILCTHCIIEDHKGHDLDSISNVKRDKINDMKERLKPLHQLGESLKHALERVSSIMSEVEVQEDFVISALDNSFSEFHKMLEERKSQLMKELLDKVETKVQALKQQESQLSVASIDVSSFINFAETYSRSSADVEFLTTCSEIDSRINQEVQKRENLKSMLEPVEVADLTVDIQMSAGELKLLSERKIKMAHTWVVTLEKPEVINVNDNTELTLRVKGDYKTPIPVPAFSLRHCSSKNQPLIKVLQSSLGEYQAAFKPNIRGRYELSISINHRPVVGSPFPLFVTVPLTKLGKTLKVWGGFQRPINLAINKWGEVIVAEFGGSIKILNKDGKLLRSVQPTQHKMIRLKSVAIDTDDTFFFVDGDSNKVGKADRECSSVEICELSQVMGPGFFDVATYGGHVMLTEWNNESKIMVYDKDFQYSRCITGRENTMLRMLHPDRHGNMYATDNAHSVQVFGESGDFVRCIGNGRNVLYELKSPWMVHVSEKHVFVADTKRRKTLIYTIEGRYVTMLNSYAGMYADADGFLFSCDYVHGKICCN